MDALEGDHLLEEKDGVVVEVAHVEEENHTEDQHDVHRTRKSFWGMSCVYCVNRELKKEERSRLPHRTHMIQNG